LFITTNSRGFRCYSTKYYNNYNSTIKSDKKKKRLYPYLAGLIESDGVLITPNNSSGTPTIYISLQEKERPFAEYLKNSLGWY